MWSIGVPDSSHRQADGGTGGGDHCLRPRRPVRVRSRVKQRVRVTVNAAGTAANRPVFVLGHRRRVEQVITVVSTSGRKPGGAFLLPVTRAPATLPLPPADLSQTQPSSTTSTRRGPQRFGRIDDSGESIHTSHLTPHSSDSTRIHIGLTANPLVALAFRLDGWSRGGRDRWDGSGSSAPRVGHERARAIVEVSGHRLDSMSDPRTGSSLRGET